MIKLIARIYISDAYDINKVLSNGNTSNLFSKNVHICLRIQLIRSVQIEHFILVSIFPIGLPQVFLGSLRKISETYKIKHYLILATFY